MVQLAAALMWGGLGTQGLGSYRAKIDILFIGAEALRYLRYESARSTLNGGRHGEKRDTRQGEAVPPIPRRSRAW